MMRIASASNISVAAETGDSCRPQSLLPSTTEKRNHAEIGDGSQQSPPPPSEKRHRFEIVQQKASKSPPPTGGEEKLCKCEGIGEREKMTFDKLPAYAKESYQKIKESFGPLWDELNMGSHHTSNEQIGDIGFLAPDPDPEPNQNSPGFGGDDGKLFFFGADEDKEEEEDEDKDFFIWMNGCQ